MWRHVASNALTLFIVALVVIVGLVAWGRTAYHAAGPLEQAMCLRIQSGATLRRVSDELARRGAVSNPSVLRIGADYSGLADKVKAGSFLVPAHASMAQIVDIVTRGGASTCGTEVVLRIGVSQVRMRVRELDPATRKFVNVAEFDPQKDAPAPRYEKAVGAPDTRYRVAIAEGTTVWQVVEALKAAGFLSGDVARLPPEGMLAPDSYEVTAGSSRAALLDRMQQAQKARLRKAWAHRAEGLPFETPREALVLASLVEKETGVAEERRQVASVFVNRLKRGIRLQTDPAVIYGLTDGRGQLGRGLRQSELRKKTPYNTYVIDGLPPTPIANPGEASIEAAVNPAQTDYLFFVADGTGGHAFAATLAEHNRNVAAWREIEASRGGN